MRQDQFKQLQVGNRVTHPPAFIGFLTIVHIETSYGYSTTPASQWINAFTTDAGHRMKACGERSRTIGDTPDVLLLRKIN